MPNPLEFVSFDSYFADLHPHVLFYGFNGTGKTTLAGKTGMRTVLLDCGDSGVVTLRGVGKNLKIIRILSWEHYLDVVEKLNRMADNLDLLVTDTLTGLASMCIKKVKGRRGSMNIKKWSIVSSQVIECISETRNFPKDVIYLAQERKKGKLGDEEAPTLTSPSLSPSIREYLSGCVDWVGRLYIEDQKRKLSFLLTDTVEAKDRGGIFPKVITLAGGPDKSPYPQIRQRILDSVKAQPARERGWIA